MVWLDEIVSKNRGVRSKKGKEWNEKEKNNINCLNKKMRS